MSAVVVLVVGFGSIIAFGTLLVAVHDLIEAAFARRCELAARGAQGGARFAPRRVPHDGHHLSQFEGGCTPSARSKMYASAASKPAGRVSRWRTPEILR